MLPSIPWRRPAYIVLILASTFSQGNSGIAGPFYSSAPATSRSSFAVGSSQNAVIPRYLLQASLSTNSNASNITAPAKPFGWTDGSPSHWGNVTLPLWIPELHQDKDWLTCSWVTEVQNLTGWAVLMKSDIECGDFVMSTFISAIGASHILVYSESNSYVPYFNFLTANRSCLTRLQ